MKAYDRVEWRYIEWMLEKIRFSTWWIWLIMRCVSSVSFKVFNKWSHIQTFCSNEGYPIGIPVTPFPFCCVMGGFREEKKLVTKILVAKALSLYIRFVENYMSCTKTSIELNFSDNN